MVAFGLKIIIIRVGDIMLYSHRVMSRHTTSCRGLAQHEADPLMVRPRCAHVTPHQVKSGLALPGLPLNNKLKE